MSLKLKSTYILIGMPRGQDLPLYVRKSFATIDTTEAQQWTMLHLAHAQSVPLHATYVRHTMFSLLHGPRKD